MSETAGVEAAAKIGFSNGDIVREIGWDDDVDEELRRSVTAVVGAELEDEDYDGVCDSVVFWFRDGDGDLTDDIVDALATLEDKGFIVLLVPESGDELNVDAVEIQEAATTAGLKAGSSLKVGQWIGTKLVQGGTAKQR